MAFKNITREIEEEFASFGYEQPRLDVESTLVQGWRDRLREQRERDASIPETPFQARDRKRRKRAARAGRWDAPPNSKNIQVSPIYSSAETDLQARLVKYQLALELARFLAAQRLQHTARARAASRSKRDLTDRPARPQAR